MKSVSRYRENEMPIFCPTPARRDLEVCDADGNPLTPALSPQGRGEGVRTAHRSNCTPGISFDAGRSAPPDGACGNAPKRSWEKQVYFRPSFMGLTDRMKWCSIGQIFVENLSGAAKTR